MKIVVLAGGTSTEREISIVSGTGICGALRQKGHEAILVDIFCGVENVDWENPFPAEYDVEKAAEYMSSFNPQIKEMEKKRRSFFGPNVLELVKNVTLCSLDFTAQMVRMERCRLPLTCWESVTQEPVISAVPWLWISVSPRKFS